MARFVPRMPKASMRSRTSNLGILQVWSIFPHQESKIGASALYYSFCRRSASFSFSFLRQGQRSFPICVHVYHSDATARLAGSIEAVTVAPIMLISTAQRLADESLTMPVSPVR